MERRVLKPVCVEVAYALPHEQRLVVVSVPPGTNALEAVTAARLADYFPEFVPEPALLGLWGRAFGTKGLPKAEDYVVQDGDRIECYRPLVCDPKEVRRLRAAKAALKRV
jgi:putative ubiquitin-RnfH superfamily antitoxin RatB of RatAB toxin-antitoxin module